MDIVYTSQVCNREGHKSLKAGFMAVLMVIVGMSFTSFEALADSLTLNYQIGSQNWLEATFTDVSGGVQLTLSGLNTGDGVNGLYFNLNPSLSASSLLFTGQGQIGSTFSGPTIQTGVDQFKVDEGGKYDIRFTFGGNAISAGDSATFLISGIGGLTARDFDYLSTQSAGGFGPTESTAILTDNGGNTVTILDDANVSSVPDGFATVILLGISMVGIEGLRRKLHRS